MNAMKGIRVLDLTMGIAGPSAGMMCAQYGAEVTKIEPPNGDWGRVVGQRQGDLSPYSTVYNRGKRSLAIDLKDPEGRAIVANIAQEADVVLESFRPGVMKRFGLDYESVRAGNPRVIYLSVTGFGDRGPMVERPATDIVMQSFSGFMTMNKSDDGTPRRLNIPIIDITTGLYAYQAIATALLGRERGGTGQFIDCSLMKAALTLQAPRMVEYVLEGGLGIYPPWAPSGVVPTRDSFLAIGVMHDHHFVALCKVLGREDLPENPDYATRACRFEHRHALMKIVGDEFQKYDTQDLSERLANVEILNTQPLDYGQLLDHPQVHEMNAVTWVRQDGYEQDMPAVHIPGTPPVDPAAPVFQAPHIGQHSIMALKSWGVEQETIDRLIERGTVLQHQAAETDTASASS